MNGMSVPWSGSALSGANYSAAEIDVDKAVCWLLDQRLLPEEQIYRRCADVDAVADGIRDMVVRGAPAIGIAAAYGMSLAARAAAQLDASAYQGAMEEAAVLLDATRPTAVNLAWAIGRCRALAAEHADDAGEARWRQQAELARRIHREDVASCQAMGRIGAQRLPESGTVLTHCNAGALATGGYGTALGVIRAAVAEGKQLRVIASETRPYLQGARLTAWELNEDGIDVTVISDSMVGHCMQRGMIDAVVVGADRIADNGDVANKIGTYAAACLARQHEVPFYVAAPWSTVDVDTAHGDSIVIEQRARDELAAVGDHVIVPAGVAVYNPAFDVTPARLVSAIVTERGLVEPGAEHFRMRDALPDGSLADGQSVL
jgi:methylthioribose-1-phosphate isomerase